MKRRVTKTNSVNHQHFISELIIRDLNFNDTGTLTCVYNVSRQNLQNSAIFCRKNSIYIKWMNSTFLKNVDYSTFWSICATTFTNTNFYYTLFVFFQGTVDLTSIDNSASVHLYVEDKEHLLKYSGLDFFYAVQRQTFILPCMPTHPDVNITLFRSGQPVDLKENYISYDPKVRFTEYCFFKLNVLQIWIARKISLNNYL